MDIRTRCTRTLLAVLAVMLSCTPTGKPPGPPPIEFEHEPLAAHCFSSAATTGLFPLGDDPDTFLMHFRPTNGPSSSKTGALITRDGGRTFDKLVGKLRSAETSGEGPRPMGGVNEPVIFLDEDFYLAGSGSGVAYDSDGSSIIEQHWVVMVLDGHPLEALGAKNTLTLADGAKSDMVWKGDTLRWVARGGGFLYATRDAGRTWERIGPAHVILPEARNLYFQTLAATADRAVHITPTDGNRAYLSTPGGTPKPLSLPGTPGSRNTTTLLHVTGAFWGNKLAVAVTSGGIDSAEVFVSDDLANWTKLELADNGPLRLQLHVDRQNRLWAYPTHLSPGQRFLIYRWEPGETRPKIIDLEAGVGMSAMSSFWALSDGRFRFLAVPDVGLSRYTQPWVICEAGPGVSTRFDTLVTEGLEALDTGRVILAERFQVGSASTDHIAFSPAGRVYATYLQAILAGPPDMPALYESSTAHEDGLPFGIFDASETGVWVTLGKALALNSPPFDHLVRFDARTGARTATQRLPKNMSMDIFNVREARGRKLLHTQKGTFFADRLLPGENEEPPPKFPTQMVVSGRHGAVVEGLDYYRLGNKPTQWALRFDPLKEEVPSLETCGESPRPAGCIDISDTMPADAEWDLDGTLYLLDYGHGRVLALPPEASAFVEVARGFATPSDLVVRQVGGKTALFVYDGDVYAFRPEPGMVKVRGAGTPASTEKVVYGPRDLHDCYSGGPCLEEPSGGAIDASPTACVTGRDLGDAAGTVLVGAVPAQVDSWSAARVCFRLGEGSRDGLLWLVTQDGRRSNRVAVRAPVRIDRWEVPAPLPIDGTYRVVGHNLASLSVRNAAIVVRGEDFLELAPTGGGESYVSLLRETTTLDSRLVRAVPRLAYGCRVGAGELCELLGAGLGDGGTFDLAGRGYTATVGGLPATLTRWNEERVSLFPPAGITPGVHPVVLHSPLTGDATTELEVLAVAPEVLVTDGPTPGALRFFHSRPVRTGEHLLVPVDRWAYGTISGVRTPMQLDTLFALVGTGRRDGFPPGHNQPVSSVGGYGESAAALHAVETEDGVVQVSLRKGSPHIAELARLRPPASAGGTWSYAPLGTLSLPYGARVQVAAAGRVSGRLVAALANTLEHSTTLFDVVAGPGTATVASSTKVAWSPYLGQSAGATFSGAHVTPQGVYLGSCRRPGAGATLHFVPVTVGTDGALSFGAMEPVLANPTARLIACNTTPDGLIWVLRDGGGEHVEEHRAGVGVTRLRTLPTSLPGVGDTWTFSAAQEVPGVVDLLRLPDGDLLLAVNEQNAEPRGLRLARLSSTPAFTLSPLVPPGTLAQPGERCVGPASSQCARPAMDGCAPFACSMLPWQRVERGTDHIGTAWIAPIRPGDTTATLVFEATATRRTRAYTYGGTDVQAVTLPIP
ncbi:hypothetical protein F0U59_01590 [Archangium gephyra]|nr:hypothetical protein F0U59_01590 [Archangium gephyra]